MFDVANIRVLKSKIAFVVNIFHQSDIWSD